MVDVKNNNANEPTKKVTLKSINISMKMCRDPKANVPGKDLPIKLFSLTRAVEMKNYPNIQNGFYKNVPQKNVDQLFEIKNKFSMDDTWTMDFTFNVEGVSGDQHLSFNDIAVLDFD